ncbi:uncharacterized protein BDCG_17282 [Blastomyces dermatitidis ER-3]|uniref:Uncharacterized protein n=1 Tax=Ajellomyces dermatitidis (strain ER-3 / ATCC MYA-2586) TaxID=559297 RepID=A0ABX2VXM9_AJEDR|nr:uncharacterized protein BDCG_17282 [Blastomyces dermatitidis ER-3]OAT01905.1 hypothetical protein BDCG_17282 [Blastomyces dermatitidis ER-3]
MAVKRARDRPDIDELISRRNNTSLQGTVTTAAATKEVEGEGGVTMKAVLSQLIDTTASAFNLAFLTVTEAAAAPQRHLLPTRKCQNKPSTVLQG